LKLSIRDKAIEAVVGVRNSDDDLSLLTEREYCELIADKVLAEVLAQQPAHLSLLVQRWREMGTKGIAGNLSECADELEAALPEREAIAKAIHEAHSTQYPNPWSWEQLTEMNLDALKVIPYRCADAVMALWSKS
jgi:tagatose-1,6-bisphosphate aldolase non-catalytic subunit AgaZ/GatZ